MLVWKLWTVYTGMFAVTAILSCVIKIRGLFKSTKCGRLKMSNLKLSQPGVVLKGFCKFQVDIQKNARVTAIQSLEDLHTFILRQPCW